MFYSLPLTIYFVNKKYFTFVIKLKNKSKVLLINTSKDVYCPTNII